ncbi:TlpA disulfide reductase family protein [Paludicola sp. MB14-C6]|uniref:TlpA family protein disulfide reductase n=1 Tax=Paludihabitans sp. MB14-C6 TaxID=3070656 RepID=UPI0027DE7585|nr:TlpA disulfide reductase family protein [Paludicola sp. MB14-C6]WMJ24038.1 TlpA disulfide reductase family protein [Paludicola sp. MB14-C6]
MNKKRNTILVVILLAVVLAIASVAYTFLSKRYKPNSQSPSVQQQTSSQVNEEQTTKASDFTVVDANGKEVQLSDFKGKSVVLNFWASWCGPCQSEMPHFNKIYQENKNEIQFMMVDLVDGQRETVEKGKKFILDNKYTFPVFFDTTQEAGMTYGITSIPSTLLIDKEGNVVKAFAGVMDEETLVAAIKQIK